MSIEKRGKSYCIRVDLPRGIDGKRHQKYIGCRGLTRRQAEEKERQIRSQLHAGAYAEPNTQTVAAYLTRWLGEMQTHLSPTTHGNYSYLVSRHVSPHIGHIRLSALTPLHLHSLYNRLLGVSRYGTRQDTLSPRTVKNVHGVIRSALNKAVRWGLLQSNPAERADPPRVVRREIQTATDTNVADLLREIEASPYRIPILIALATGMRRGEVLALRWEDFDPQEGTLLVRRSIVRARGGVIEKETKTGRARAVVLPESLVEELARHRPYADPVYICRIPGHSYSPSALSNAFARLAEKVGAKCTFHGLRHTYATELIAAGIPVAIVSRILGHSTVVVTQDLYTHVATAMQRPAAALVEERLQRAKRRGE